MCLSLPSIVFAQGIEVSPIMVELMPGQMTTTVLVTNKSTATIDLQVRPFEWDEIGGNDNLKATTELAVSPPITQLEAGQTQTFRLVLRRPAVGKEASYRLLLDQLPTANPAGAVLVLLRFSIPVFVKPGIKMAPDLAWRVTVDQAGAYLVGTNHGDGHVRLLNPVLTQPDGRRVNMAVNQSPYILPGAERSWHIQTSGPLRPGATLHLAAMSDGEPIDAMVHVSMP